MLGQAVLKLEQKKLFIIDATHPANQYFLVINYYYTFMHKILVWIMIL